jgi:Right handed beta helix region
MYLKACRIAANEVLGGREAGIVADGVMAPGGLLDVSGNTVTNPGAGIVVGPDASVAGNVIAGAGDPNEAAKLFGDGILVRQPDLGGDPGAVQVHANRVASKNGAGIRLTTAARSFTARDNVVSVTSAGIGMTGKGTAASATIAGNDVFDVDDSRGRTFGILTRLGEAVAIEANTLTNIGRRPADRGLCAGIAAVGGGDVRVAGNQLSGIGPEGETLATILGVLVAGTFEHAVVTENAVRPTATPQGRTRWHAVAVLDTGAQLLQMAPSMPVFTAKKGVLVTAGSFAFFVALRPNRATISTNVLAGGGEFPTCLARVRADVLADANLCEHRGNPEAMVLGGAAISAATNRVFGGDVALVLDVAEDRFAAVGNLAAQGVHLGSFSNPVPAPWAALNPMVF